MNQQSFSGYPQPPATTAAPMTKVELSISASGLSDRDVLSKSDPVCILFCKEQGNERFYEYGRTEQIKDTLNPKWIKKFEMDFRFEERQVLKFHIIDWDTKTAKINEQDKLGYVDCSLGEIMGHQGSHFKKNITGGAGTLLICGEEVSSCKEVATFTFSAKDCDKKDFFGKSDPFLVFSKVTESNTVITTYKSEVIKNTLNPTWPPMIIPGKDLCSGDQNKRIKIECYDWDSDGSHDLIGICYTDFKTLKQGSGAKNIYPLINEKKRLKKRGYNHSGRLILNNIQLHEEPSFLDYIRGGCQLHFSVAVDFTASNGDPSQPNSLHYRQPGVDNQYSIAIRSVGEIIEDYDSDKMFPGLGFGARFPNGAVSHEFFLNGRNDNPYCQGVQSLLDAYNNSLNTLQLYGPTNFTPVIRHVMNFATNFQDGNNYFILLIITDGIITDMEATKRALVEASGMPMSVIIVGVGNEDFRAMELLDGDVTRLHAGGVYAERDIVQFVELRKHLRHQYQSKELLAKDVLAEIPEQFLGWMKSRKFKPKPPVVPPPVNTYGMH